VDDITLSYGDHLPDEAELRLCGDVNGKRVIELGVTSAVNAVGLARRGAKTMVVDPSADNIATVRTTAEANEVSVECHQADLADLGFATSASVDLVLCAGGLDRVEDVPRLFRQVHRVLRTGAAFVLALPHPFASMVHGATVQHDYWGLLQRHTVSSLFTSLSRANFQVDVLLEPEPRSGPSVLVPPTLLLRSRKLGV
jgi:ubiquinone/menaquinone biosynthesis C-methylase UbiE